MLIKYKKCELHEISNKSGKVREFPNRFEQVTRINNKNHSKTFEPEVTPLNSAFSDAELKVLWRNASDPFINLILILCYTGWRPQELFTIMRDDVDPDELIMIGGMKLCNGKRREIPVPSRIEKIFLHRYWFAAAHKSERYICCEDGSLMSYDKYHKRFMIKMAAFGMKHRPQDTRATFETMAKNRGVDEYAIKYILGQGIDDSSKEMYAERDIEWLRLEIEKI